MPRLGLVILAVVDFERAVRFYRAAFGWEQPVAAPVYAEFLLPGGMRLGLYAREGFGRNTGQAPAITPAGALAPTELYLYDDEPARAVDRALQAGARLLSPLGPRDWGDEAAYLADPDGNVLVLARPLASAG